MTHRPRFRHRRSFSHSLVISRTALAKLLRRNGDSPRGSKAHDCVLTLNGVKSRNITFSLPADLIRSARIYAAERKGTPASKIAAASIDFIDDGGIRVAQFVPARFLGRIGGFQEA